MANNGQEESVPKISLDDVYAQVDDLINYLETAKGEIKYEALKNSITEAVWRSRNIAWSVNRLRQQAQGN
jgi:hypothetical protein